MSLEPNRREENPKKNQTRFGKPAYRDKQRDPDEEFRKRSLRERKWTEPVRDEYERQEARAYRRGKCKGKTVFGTDCPASASPSGSGYCSTHEQQAVTVGETINAVNVKPCADCKRNPRWGNGETNYCADCMERRARMARAVIAGEAPDDDEELTFNEDDL